MNAFQEAIKALLTKARDEGMSRRATAEAFGISYDAICIRIRSFEIDWPDGRAERYLGPGLAPSERNLDILARHNAGELHTVIAADYGITRERVRQIVKKAGAPSKGAMRRADLVKLAEFLKANPMTLGEAMKTLSKYSRALNEAAQIAGIEFLKITAAKEAELAPLADQVKAGKSYHDVAGHNRAVAARLMYYCRKKGIKSIAASRWSVSPKRAELIAKLRGEGKSWPEVAVAVTELEGTRPAKPASIYMWAVNNMDLPRQPRQRKEKPIRQPRVPKIRVARSVRDPVEVERRQTVRETALAYRGRATAAEIAKACGTTRNAVIGYWNRARMAGLVA